MKRLFGTIMALLLGAGVGFLSGRADRPEIVAPPLAVEVPSRPPPTPPPPAPTAPKPKVEREQITWAQLDSEDLQELMRRLRAVGCSEETIADILRARILLLCQGKLKGVVNPLAMYWETAAEGQAQDAQVRDILAERDRLLAEFHLEGVAIDTESALPPEAQPHIAEALRRFPKIKTSGAITPEGWAQAMAARQARVNYLSQFLTPDELLTYRITQDGSPDRIDYMLQGINATEEEFRKVFAALDNGEQGLNGSAPETLAKLKEALGPERYAEYRGDQESGNTMFRHWANMAGLTDEQVNQLTKLRGSAHTMDDTQYRQAAEDIIQNPSVAMRFLGSPALRRPMPSRDPKP